ncbi:PD40 domain-containing protein [Streptomyces dangxiongensis]|uniref:PD40 domain-containing protein n=1 Tax=Streptomyces dangxiongensis TaxID=1442032 RepID=UPI0013CE8AC3|nr:PD40 domain-containing protein [Streptomyces dangxiongensis]
MLTACGGGAADGGSGARAEGSGDGKKTADVKSASLAQSGSLTVAYCHEIPNGNSDPVYGLTLRSYSAKNGAVVGERSVVLPSDVEPETVCEEGSFRSLATFAFNKDMSLIAGITDAGETARAGAYDLTTGKEVSPPDPDAFTERATNKGVAFHPTTGLLWYDESDHESDDEGFGSRDARAGYSTEKHLNVSQAAAVVTQDAATTSTALAANAWPQAVTPSGDVAADLSDTPAYGPMLALYRVTSDGGSSGGYKLTDLTTKGLDGRETCAPTFWRDATTLVCGMQQITLASDYSRVVKNEDLVPANDRDNRTPVPSPDGKSFAFLSSGEGEKLTLYRGDLSSIGAQPVKVADLEPPLDGSDDHLATLVRWN